MPSFNEVMPRLRSTRALPAFLCLFLPLIGLPGASAPRRNHLRALPASRPVGASSIPTGYTVTIMPNPIAGSAESVALNNYGQVALGAIGGANETLYVWTPNSANSPNGQLHDTSTPISAAVYLNDYGQVLSSDGKLWTPSSPHAATGALTSLDLPGRASAISADGTIAGTSGQPGSTGELFLWTPAAANTASGSWRLLTSGGNYNYAYAINASHLMCGIVENVAGIGGYYPRAMAITPAGAMTLLPEPILGANWGDVSYAEDLNDSGEIVGFRTDLSGTTSWYAEAVIWSQSSGFAKSEAGGYAQHINNQGDLLGHAKLWNRVGTGGYVENAAVAEALQQAGITSYELVDLNNAGQIVGIDQSSTAVFLLSPGEGRELKLFDANIDYTSGQVLPAAAGQSLEPFTTTAWQQAAEERPMVAADGVTLMLLRLKLPADTSGTARFRLEENPVINAELGSLWPVDSASLKDGTTNGGTRDAGAEGPTQLDVPTVLINGARWAFALYRSPRNYDPDESTWQSISRNLVVRAGIAGEPVGNTVDAALAVTRPLVILQHGTFSNVETWSVLPSFIQPENGFTLWLQGAQEDHQYQYTQDQIGRVPFYVARTSFAEIFKAAGPLSYNAEYVLPKVISKLSEWRRKLDVAGTQADVITHSYGGPTMRRVSEIEQVTGPNGQSDPLTISPHSFRRLQNWGHGYFHKLITIAGSHRGSAMTNHAARLNQFGAKPGRYGQIAYKIDKPTYLGAMRDQFVMSPAMRALRESRYPSHAFVGSGLIEGGDTLYENVPFTSAYTVDVSGGPYALALRPFAFPVPGVQGVLHYPNLKRSTNYHFNLSYTTSAGPEGDPNYDLTVSSRSASAGLTKPYFSDITDLAGTNLQGKVSHLTQTNSRLVAERMMFLLRQKTTSQYFTHFPPGSGPGSKPLDATEAKLSNLRDYDPAWLLLGTPQDPTAAAAVRAAAVPGPTLTCSVPGPDVCPGDHLTFAVAWPGKTIDVAQLIWRELGGGEGVAILGGTYLSHEMTVPNLPPGAFGVAAVVRATDGSSDVASVPLEICDPTTYTELRTEPEELVLRSTAPAPLQVYGHLPNGAWRWLGGSSHTTITSADPLTAQVNSDLSITPMKFGSTTLNVEHRGVMLGVPVTVDGTPVQVMAVLKGKKPTLDSRSTKPVDFAFLSSAAFDARTIASETILIGGRAAQPQSNGALFKLKDVNRDRKLDLLARQIPAYLHLSPGAVQIRMLAATTNGTLVGGSATATAR